MAASTSISWACPGGRYTETRWRVGCGREKEGQIAEMRGKSVSTGSKLFLGSQFVDIYYAFDSGVSCQ